MTCDYSQYIGSKEIEGVEYMGAKCSKCWAEIWFPALAQHRREPGTYPAFTVDSLVAPLPAGCRDDRTGDSHDLFGKTL